MAAAAAMPGGRDALAVSGAARWQRARLSPEPATGIEGNFLRIEGESQ